VLGVIVEWIGKLGGVGSLLWRAVALACVVLVVWLHGYGRGAHTGFVEVAALRASAATAAAQASAQAERVVTKVEIRYRDRVRVIEREAERVRDEIPIYITREAERACELPSAFVWVHNRAAGGDEAAGPAPVSADAPAAVTLADTAETLTENYAAYHQCAERVAAWQAFYAGVRASYGAKQ
jgi:hypothetical protein